MKDTRFFPVADRRRRRGGVWHHAVAGDPAAAADGPGRGFGGQGRYQPAGLGAHRHAEGRRRRHGGAWSGDGRAGKPAAGRSKAGGAGRFWRWPRRIWTGSNSIRPETVAAHKAELDSAKADETLAQETFNRQTELARTGTTRRRRGSMKSPATLIWLPANASPRKRRCNWPPKAPARKNGALAAAQVKQAEATLNQRDTDVGRIRHSLADRGPGHHPRGRDRAENFSAGAPLFSMIDMNHLWFTFNLREDLLGGLKIGDKFDVTVPALKSEVIPVHVTMINVQGAVRRLAGDTCHRRFRPADVRGPRLAGPAGRWSASRHECGRGMGQSRGADMLGRRDIRPGFSLVFWAGSRLAAAAPVLCLA